MDYFRKTAVLLIAFIMCGQAEPYAGSEHASLAPPSKISEDRDGYLQAEKLFGTGRAILADLASRKTIREVAAKHRAAPGWQESFQEMIYLEQCVDDGAYLSNTVILPLSEGRLLLASDTRAEIIGVSKALRLLDDTVKYGYDITDPGQAAASAILDRYDPQRRLARQMYAAVRAGTPLADVIEKFRHDAAWRDSFADAILIRDTLYLPHPSEKGMFILTGSDKQHPVAASWVWNDVISHTGGTFDRALLDKLGKYDPYIPFAYDIFNDLRSGLPAPAITAKYSPSLFWTAAHKNIRYLNGMLYFPAHVGVGTRYRISPEKLEIITEHDAEKELIEQFYTHREKVGAPFSLVPKETTRRVLFEMSDTSFYRGDNVVMSMVLRSILNAFPRAEVTVLNRYPELWEGIERVRPVDRLPAQERSFDLVVSLEVGTRAWDTPYEISIDRYRNSFVFTDWQKNRSVPVADAPLYTFDDRDSIEEAHTGINFDTTGNSYRFHLRLTEALSGENKADIRPLLRVEEAEKAPIREMLAGLNIPEPDKDFIILLNPFSRMVEKEFSLRSWQKILGRLLALLPENATVVVERGYLPRHERLIGRIETFLKTGKGPDREETRKRIKVLPRNLNLRELVVLISISRMVIGPDTFSAHAANAFGRESITLFTVKKQLEYLRPLEYTGIMPTAVSIEMVPKEEKFPANIPDDELKFIDAGVSTIYFIANQKFEKFFTGGAIPVHDAIHTAWTMERIVDAVNRKRHNEVLPLWRSLYDPAFKENEHMRAFIARLREPYRSYFTREIESLPAYEQGVQHIARRFAGYIVALNIYKLMTALKHYLCDLVPYEKPPVPAQRYDLHTIFSASRVTGSDA